MIKSMTGFGRDESSNDNYKISVELKAVNHRYFDVSTKMPKKLNMFDSSIRSLLKNYIQRGKVDLYIMFEDFTEGQENVKYNSTVANEYVKYLKQMADEFGLDNDIRISSLARMPEVFSMEEVALDEEALWSQLKETLENACKQFVSSREVEGERLKEDLLNKLSEMSAYVAFIEERSPQIISEYRQRLLDKIADLLEDTKIDESRVVQEVTIFADKVCVDEEIVRLKSHIEATKEALLSGDSVGRKLDFIAQEMNREANTILSKSTDLEISNIGIELKTLIEKVREQIQNIE
ncbi:TIGR00255 family protein [Lachnospiraceae bacterium XBB1006]|nr:TIGR00255 family protein [Lachnospiraceae bacterium XBB1006]